MNRWSCLGTLALSSALSLLLFIFLLGIVRWVFSEGPVRQGDLLYVKYEMDLGRTGGFTNLNMPGAAPGGYGSYNEKRYGVLYRDFLLVTKPSERNWGTLIIPADRLLEVHFAED